MGEETVLSKIEPVIEDKKEEVKIEILAVKPTRLQVFYPTMDSVKK